MKPFRATFIILVAGTIAVSAVPVMAEWFALDGTSRPAAPVAKVIEQAPDHLIIKWEIPGIIAEPVTTPSGDFISIRFHQTSLLSNSQPGTPQLPFLYEIITLPRGTRAEVSVRQSDWVALKIGRILPAQAPLRNDEHKEWLIDNEAYRSKSAIPKEIVSSGEPLGWGGLPISAISCIPFQYIPSTGELSVARSMTITVKFTPDGDVLQPVGPVNSALTDAFRSVLLNPPEFFEPVDADQNEPVRLLVIVLEEALETVQPLIDFHDATGLRTEVWLGDDIEDPAEIRDRITDMFEEGLQYVLIVGDGYYRTPHIPMFWWDPADPGPDDDNTGSFSDWWYVCLDGPDNRGFPDHIAELSIGRLVYEGDNLDELEVQITKLLNYYLWDFEQRDGEWLSRALLIADDDFQDGVREYLVCKQDIEAFDYQLEAPEFITAYGINQNATNQFVRETINNGVGIVNYRGHGDETRQATWNRRNESITRATVRQMQNAQRPFVLVSSACLNADIAKYGLQFNNECLLESYQKHTGGSVAAHGSIISSYTFGNSFYDRMIFRQWFDEGIYGIGVADIAARAAMVAAFDQHAWPTIGRTNTRTYIWLGDPSLEVRQRNPQNLVIDAPERIPVASRAVTVVINSGDEPVEGVRVCVRTEDNAIYRVGVTNDDGEAVIEFDEGQFDEAVALQVGAYERNSVPAFGEILVLDGFAFIQGRVTDLETEEPIPGATVVTNRFNLETMTGADGRFQMGGIPNGNYTITVFGDGYLPLSADVQLAERDSVEVNFALRFAELVVDVAEIHAELFPEEETQSVVNFTNVGNGTAEWSAGIDFTGNREPFEVISGLPITVETGDDRINGVVRIGERYYVAGGNHNADPNFIYILDRQGRLIDRFEQPRECAGIGMHDLATDGRFIYGSGGEEIFVLSVDGEIIDRFPSPYNPAVGLTFDSNGMLWVANNRQDLLRIDLDGNVEEMLPNTLPVRGLGWYPNDPDSRRLLLLVRGDDGEAVQLHKVSVTDGRSQMVAVLNRAADEIPNDGLTITNGADPSEIELLVSIDNGGVDSVRILHYDYLRGWIDITPTAGVLEAGADTDLTVTLNSAGLELPMELTATVIINNNGREARIEIPVTLGVRLGVDEAEPQMPHSFRLNSVFPNPFNNSLKISVDVPLSGRLKMRLYDINGRFVMDVADKIVSAGAINIQVDAGHLPTGLYLLNGSLGTSRFSRKVALIR